MKVNMGTVDRAIRVVIALCIAVLYFTGRLGGTLGIVLGVVAILFLFTGLTGWCPGYLPFGISTRKQPPGSTPA